MYRVTLTDQQRLELNRRAHQRDIPPSTRDRLEMVRLADAGWRIPRIAPHLGQHEQTVRYWIKAFLKDGFDALADKARGGSTSALTPAMLEAVREEVRRGERTWNAQQIAALLAERFGVVRSAAQVRRKLRQTRLSYKRSSRSLKHKQNQEQVAAKKEELATLEKRGRPVS